MGREERAGEGEGAMISAQLRSWLWANFGWDIYDWDDDDIRF
jgi:hypothetical protein